MRSSRFTIGQVMLVIAVFASLLAVPRLAASSDRIVMVCLVGLLTGPRPAQLAGRDGPGEAVSCVFTLDVAQAGEAPSLLPLQNMRGTVQVVWTGPLA